jgi:MiaB/RimO family radical SAM methylthiotransferase
MDIKKASLLGQLNRKGVNMFGVIEKKIFIATAGCARRNLDCSRLEEYFKANKYRIVKAPQKADHIIFVTCSYKQTKEEESWKYIEEYQKCRGELIVVGCLPEIAPIKFNEKFKGRYVSTKNLEEIDQFFSKFKIKFKDISDGNKIKNSYQVSFLDTLRKRLFVSGFVRSSFISNVKQIKMFLIKALYINSSGYLRVSDGCPEQCAYCSIYRAVGKLRSKTVQACVEEYKKLLRKGYRKVTILADNVGAYGLDNKSSFAELLHNLALASNEKIYWCIEELHPRWVIRYKTELLKMVEEKRIREIMCAIQSGSNRMLKLMNRPHSIEEIKAVLGEFKKANPGLRLCTQVIIGFPSETEEEFRETLNAVNEARFDLVSLYPYYDGYDTIASKMDGKIDKAIINRRIKEAVDFLNRKGIAVNCNEIDLDLT